MLSIDGDQILGFDGNPIILCGFSWGRWGTAQPQDGNDNKSQGANMVRIPLRWYGLYSSPPVDSRDESIPPPPGHINPINLGILDNMMLSASQAGLIIDLFTDSDCGQNGLQGGDWEGHSGPGFGGGTSFYCDPDQIYPNGHNFFTDIPLREEFLAMQAFLNRRYLNLPGFCIFEPLPEPNPSSASTLDIQQFYRESINNVLNINQRMLYIVGPRGYDSKKTGQDIMDDANLRNKLIHTVDIFYHTGKATQDLNIADVGDRLQLLTTTRSTYHRPVFVQQMGCQSSEDPDSGMPVESQCTQFFIDARVGFCRWEYRDDIVVDGYGLKYLLHDGTEVTKTARLALISTFLQEASSL